MIKKCGKNREKWCLYDHKGKKVLGRHDTEAEAKSQEAAINISKARAAGYRIAKRPAKK